MAVVELEEEELGRSWEGLSTGKIWKKERLFINLKSNLNSFIFVTYRVVVLNLPLLAAPPERVAVAAVGVVHAPTAHRVGD